MAKPSDVMVQILTERMPKGWYGNTIDAMDQCSDLDKAKLALALIDTIPCPNDIGTWV